MKNRKISQYEFKIDISLQYSVLTLWQYDKNHNELKLVRNMNRLREDCPQKITLNGSD